MMNTTAGNTSKLARRIITGAAIFTACILITLKLHANDIHNPHSAGGGNEQGIVLTGILSPASMASRLTGLPEHVSEVASLNEQQKIEITKKVSEAQNEINILQPDFQQRQEKIMELLLKERIDNSTIDALRREQLTSADSVSRRVTRLMTDISAMLTQTQRDSFAGKQH